MADFDPKAFLKKTEAVAPPPQVGAFETFVNRAVGTYPAGSLVTDLLSTAVEPIARRFASGGERATLTPQAQAELDAMEAAGGEVEAPPETPGALDRYRQFRDTRRLRTAEGSKQNPKAAIAGTTTGVIQTALAPLPKTAVGATRGLGGQLVMGPLARIGNAALTGAGYGAFGGLTDGEADLTRGDVGGALRDTVTGGVWGGLSGAGAAGATELLRPLAGALRRLAVRQGKQTIQGNSDIAAATREPLSDEAVEEVLQSGAIRPFSTTQATAQRIENLARESGDEYARIVAELEARGVKGPDAEAIATELLTKGGQLQQRTLNEALPAEFLKRAEQLAEHGTSLERATGSRNLSLTQAEDFKRSLQELVRYGKLEETPLNAVRREIASVVRQANEDAVERAGQAAGEGSALRQLSERFRPVKQRTGRLLEAERFAQKGASKAEQRSPVSFKDLMVGSMTGEPLSGLALSTASSIARNRLPSTISAGAFGLSEGLRTGSLASEIAAGLAGAGEVSSQAVEDWADRAVIDERTDPITAALIRAMRKRQQRNEKEER